METFVAFLACAIAGFVNGSYASPIKNMASLEKATIWFYFSFLAFLIVPVISIILIDHTAFSVIKGVPDKYLAALFSGGFIFGVGMVLFTLCLDKLGMGIAFILNISLGTIGGSLLPLFVFHHDVFFTEFGQVNFIALILFILAISISTYAVHLRDLGKNKGNVQKNTLLGLVLGVLSGLFCAMQGFVYAYSLSTFKAVAPLFNATPYAAINIPWLVIFSAALIPYALFQLYLQVRSHSFINIFKKAYIKNLKWLFIMGLLYFISILIYSKAVLTLGQFGQILAWPLFMTFIILSSNLWSIVHGEWHGSSVKSRAVFIIGVLIIILAVIMLGYATLIRTA